MALKQATILVVDDDLDVLTAVRLLLKKEIKEIITEKNPELILSILQEKQVDLLFLDMNFKSAVHTGNEGIFWLETIQKKHPALPIVMITAYGDIDLAVHALKLGAKDFMVKPWQNERLLEIIRDIYKNTNTVPKIDALGMIGQSAVMQNVFYKIDKIAPTDANILILGENGTGKDLVANAIHQKSYRANKPFVKVDVGALTESIFESELFGHKKGAFTDARADRIGRFEAANKGTLFLDEIGNITLAQQAKLLTVLQNRHITPLGSNEKIQLDIRLLCATNLPLAALANEDKFRKDLIYRINTVEIVVPPLRDRGEDIILIAQHFAHIYAKKYAKDEVVFSKEAKKKLLQYHYPGNVRELQYAIERAIIMNDDTVMDAPEILFSPLESMIEKDSNEVEINLNIVERNTILNAISLHEGNISRAARALGITRAALYRKITKYDI